MVRVPVYGSGAKLSPIPRTAPPPCGSEMMLLGASAASAIAFLSDRRPAHVRLAVFGAGAPAKTRPMSPGCRDEPKVTLRR
jgi:hypothetical protein